MTKMKIKKTAAVFTALFMAVMMTGVLQPLGASGAVVPSCTAGTDASSCVHVVKSWNIGGSGGTFYRQSTAGRGVKATLYSNGKLKITGSGNTAVFSAAYPAPWTGRGTADYCSKVKTVTIAKTVKPADMSYWFKGCSRLAKAPQTPKTVRKMSYTYCGCKRLKTAENVPAGVKNISYAFSGTAITTAPPLPDSVTDMTGTFENCPKLVSVSSIPKKTLHMDFAFSGCKSLTSMPVLPDTVKDMCCTFSECTALKTAPNIPLKARDVSGIFYNCANISGTVTLNDLRFPDGEENNSFIECFTGAATAEGTKLTVNYTSKCRWAVMAAATASADSHVVLGEMAGTFGPDAPVIVDQTSETVTVKSGQDVTLAVKASGKDLKYVWFRYEPVRAAMYDDENVTTASWSWEAEEGCSGDKFRCVVYNSDGFAASHLITVKVT
ncbi:MAG: leucine-rich repeat domain-containing protein [Eubacteriaceae bacterium]|jgi:hypothetical protein|nr:leucine-rich repeat domain-containing protein [Eubacteriaceae bacterium]